MKMYNGYVLRVYRSRLYSFRPASERTGGPRGYDLCRGLLKGRRRGRSFHNNNQKE